MLSEGATLQEDEIVGKHFAYLKDLADKSLMILMGRTQNKHESPFGWIAIFEAENDQAARAIMEYDPAVSGG